MSRRKAETRGRRAETVAALWLQLKGYRILARRVRTPVGEVDLVARRGKSLAFVEVKARMAGIDAEAALSAAQLAVSAAPPTCCLDGILATVTARVSTPSSSRADACRDTSKAWSTATGASC